ncbi:RTA1 like protein [Lindgomyces ingoldianus]|uniref:RTA1 like protein n=1 Tax=Lindgomyces ingoldianus TaxID=673940 RepID=A0ACB6QWM1_9PLEO|nr:RTA1 like protein [Lindgomyces ingoldianus]KAF2470905.1 RTA1 like protein [Lindgomyces ingoldianus]
MAQLEPYKGGYYLWKYVPSMAAAIIFLIFFMAATFAHSYRIWKTKAWFCVPFGVGGFFEIIGYAARAAAHKRTGKLMPFALQNQGTLLAPVFFAASIYMVFGRIVASVGGWGHSIVRVPWLTKTFVIGDVFSLAVQGGGAGLMVTGSHATLAEAIVILGLMIQIVMFGLFVATIGIFHKRMRRAPTTQAFNPNVRWEQYLHMLYGVSGLIFFRSIFRVIEFALGQDGYPLTNEWTLYIFDSVPMFIVMLVFYWRFPADIKDNKAFDRAGEDLAVITP